MNPFGFFAVILGPLMRLVYSLVPNFALSLIVFTVLVRVVTLPLSIKQQKATAKTAMFQPMITEIQEKYKNNQQKQQEELMRLQEEYGFNPMSGCLPMLIDMVILFGIIEVVYRPVQYILNIPASAIQTACEALAIDVNKINTMQTGLIQAIHNGAAMPAGLSAEQFESIRSFNTTFFGMDMCDVAGLRITPLMIFPLLAAGTMFLSMYITQKQTGAQLQGGMKYWMWFMNLFFVYYCFTAPVGFSVYYATSNVVMLVRTLLVNRFYNAEKFRAQYEAELAAKKAAARSKKQVTVEEDGKQVTKTVSNRELDRLRLERARQLEDEKYAGARTTPLSKEEYEAQIAEATKNAGRRKRKS